MSRPTLPFSGVVGLDSAKLALILVGLDPNLGGVLLRGQKGSAKTTLARGFTALLPEGAPFVELPLGASEDRVVGSLDLAALLGGTPQFRPGLLAAAHGGVLYVDEINLLADHLVDVLLDVAVSGVNRVERDGVAHEHPARFVLIGSMNPEEGDLRPQLLDRFGLAVDVVAPTSANDRVEAVRRQLGVDARGGDTTGAWGNYDAALNERMRDATQAAIDDEIMLTASRVALEVGAEGLRADLAMCRAAAALAGWEGRASTTIDDLRVVAPMVLTHRRRKDPFDEPRMHDGELNDAFDAATEPGASGSSDSVPPESDDTGSDDAVVSVPIRPSTSRSSTASAAGRSVTALDASRGRMIRDRAPIGDNFRVAPVASAINVAVARVADPDAPAEPAHLREAVLAERQSALVVVVLDTSASMSSERRIGAAKSLVLALLTDAYQRRDRVALVAAGGGEARVVMRPTASVEVAQARLAALSAGGTTPLGDGLRQAAELANQAADGGLTPLVVVITDGRATAGGDDPVGEARNAARLLSRIPTLIVDAEEGTPRLGLAREFAAAANADLVALADLEANPSVIARRGVR